MAKKPADKSAEGEGEAKSRKPAAKGGSNKLALIGAVFAVLALAGGGWWFFLKAPADTRMASGRSDAKKITAFLDLPELTINLVTAAQERQQFLKLKIALEVSETRLLQEIQPVLPRVLDTFNVYLREMRPSDLEGSAAFYRLKEELMRRVNVAIYPAKIDAVLFKEALVQ